MSQDRHTKKADDTRALAAMVLADVLAGQSLNQALPPRLNKVSGKDRGFLQELCYGCLRQLPLLQGILDQLLNKPLRDKDRDVHCLILLGLYQLRDSRVPDHAAVAATVDATATLKKPWARKLTNAILRRYLRESDALCANLSAAEASAHPEWLYHAIAKQWPDQASAIFEAGNSRPPMILRVNERLSTREDYLALLAEHELDARPGKLSPQAIYLDQAIDVVELPGWEEGAVSVQDEAAQLAALALNPAAGDRVLDACSAPGGKTCHLLELHPELGALVAMDSDANRLERVEDNLERLDLRAEVICGDASAPAQELKQSPFDCILVDAPCSASGVIRRHPDIKTLRRETDISQLAQQQLAILTALWPLLTAGGKLLYVTCSILDEENSQIVEKFVQQHDDASISNIDVGWGKVLPGGRQLLPQIGEHDGLFYSLLVKAP
jgi:16S rRNA (cytosine967-C5)-methyltransferase